MSETAGEDESQNDLLDKTVLHLREHWSRMLAIPAGIGLAVQWHWATVTIAGACFVAAEVGGWKRSVEVAKLAKGIQDRDKEVELLKTICDQSQADYFDLLRDQLVILANDTLGFTDTERISVYKHDGEAFLMLGRYSKNPAFNKRGRSIYPDNQGCIAKAWREGAVFMTEPLPEPSTKAKKKLWKQKMKSDWCIPFGTSNTFSMKSRVYAAVAIEDAETHHRVAVVVLESTSNKIFDNDAIREEFETKEGKRIARFLKKMESIEPSIVFAQSEGY
ncbi:hypothetical protein [Allorhodopirellula solitaria]|uniref:Uncharacterized protein n=1 Tax=Allorhodopirellula solitaria TaxID=2527987 RepID=A0A5C5YF54_9BACT|nr:hypothetical protein [Allorhodopirellula solitaria]TWT74356.1 hypothetical protein CA85_12440 [Allorhodopirellula solitaria]